MIVFTHIPKTAGSSVNEGLSLVVGGIGNMSIKTTDEDDFSSFRIAKVVGGHIRYSDAYKRVGNAHYIAALRDPLERVLSHFFFALRVGDFTPSMQGRRHLDQGFFEFYDQIIRKRRRLNIQSAYLSANGTAKGAIEAVRNDYSIVWDVKRTDDVWPIVGALACRSDDPSPVVLEEEELAAVPALPRRAYEAPISPHLEEYVKGARPARYADWLEEKQKNVIKAENSEDVYLHDWLLEQGGIVINPKRVVL